MSARRVHGDARDEAARAPGVIAAALVGALLVVGALALLIRRRPEAFPLLAVLALPFRLPISADGRTVNLLIPLYLVVAAGMLERLAARCVAAGRGGGGERRGSTGPRPGRRTRARPSCRARRPGCPRAALNGCCWRRSCCTRCRRATRPTTPRRRRTSPSSTCPSALLFVLLRDVRWTRELLLACLGVAVALAVLFAGVGFVEYYRKSLFLNPKVVAANQYDNYFRVNSVFFDPSIYGRFLALVMIAVTDGRAVEPRARREVLLGGSRARVAAGAA